MKSTAVYGERIERVSEAGRNRGDDFGRSGGSKRDTGTKPMDSDSGKKRSSATGRDDGLFRGRADGNRGAAGRKFFRAGAAAVHIPIFICRTGWTGVWVREIISVLWKGKATDCGWYWNYA